MVGGQCCDGGRTGGLTASTGAARILRKLRCCPGRAGQLAKAIHAALKIRTA